jgi:hypothetical protein
MYCQKGKHKFFKDKLKSTDPSDALSVVGCKKCDFRVVLIKPSQKDIEWARENLKKKQNDDEDMNM